MERGCGVGIGVRRINVNGGIWLSIVGWGLIIAQEETTRGWRVCGL